MQTTTITVQFCRSILLVSLCLASLANASNERRRLAKAKNDTIASNNGNNNNNSTQRSLNDAVLRNLDDVSGNLNAQKPEREILEAVLLQQQQQQQQQTALPHAGDTRIPLWNIAHMINSIEQIDLALNNGANGIETDVSFDRLGMPVEAYHGFPCDCGRHCHFRENFVKFVSHLGAISNPPSTSRLQLVLFDLKLKELQSDRQLRTAGRQLASILYKQLYSTDYNQQTMGYRSTAALVDGPLPQPPLRVILSINYAKDLALVEEVINFMRSNQLDYMAQLVGFDVGMNDSLQNISSMWNSLNGITANIWQGDGLTNCANLIRGVERLKEAISIRNNQGHFRKIYYWTADILYHIRSVLRLGLDAILTNQPQRVVQVLQEPEFKHKYRLATPYDNPFEQFLIQPSARQMSAPTFNEAVETVRNIQKTSSEFIKTLPDGIQAAIKKVHATFV